MAETQYYDVPLPTIDADFNSWGLKNNVLHEAWDGALASPTNTIKGRNDSGTGPHENLTPAEVAAMLPAFTGDSGSGGVKALVPAPAAGDALAAKVLRADGTWGSEIKARGTFNGLTGATVSGRNITVSRSSAGQYVATISPAMPDANYQPMIQCRDTVSPFAATVTALKSTTQFGFNTVIIGGSLSDPTEISLVVLG